MEDIKKNKNLTRAYNSSIQYLAARIRSKKEIQDNLYKKKFNKDVVDEIIHILEDENLINDKIFASEFVLSREKIRPKSKFALKYELRKKGVSDFIIEDSIQGIDEYKSALAAIESKIQIWSKLDNDKFKSKMMNFLKNRGFNWEVFHETYLKTIKDIQNMEDK